MERLLGLPNSLPQRFMELEDALEQERKAHVLSVTQLEGQSRALDLKARSYADQGEMLCVEPASFCSGNAAVPILMRDYPLPVL